jgi:dUTP pyrophosphatase
MKVQLIKHEAKIPKLGSAGAAGYDLFACEDKIIPPQERSLVSTGIAIEIPIGLYGRIAPRSGLALKNGIDVMAGVVDSDYRGTIGIILYNTDKEKSFEIKTGDRIAQIIFEKCHYFNLTENEDLSSSERMNSGFGSTG